MTPITMTGYQCHLFDGVAGLEHSGDAFVPQVVQMKVWDAERIASRLEQFAESLGMHREYYISGPETIWFKMPHNLPCVSEKGNPLIVAGFPAWVFAISDEYKALLSIQVIEPKPTNLSPAHSGGYHESKYDACLFWHELDNPLDLVFGWPAFSSAPAADQPKMAEERACFLNHVWQV